MFNFPFSFSLLVVTSWFPLLSLPVIFCTFFFVLPFFLYVFDFRLPHHFHFFSFSFLMPSLLVYFVAYSYVLFFFLVLSYLLYSLFGLVSSRPVHIYTLEPLPPWSFFIGYSFCTDHGENHPLTFDLFFSPHLYLHVPPVPVHNESKNLPPHICPLIYSSFCLFLSLLKTLLDLPWA